MKFRPQLRNANKHTVHGTRLLEKSVQADGFIDAQTAAADGEIISGSARLELAAEKFADVEPIIVHSDGSRPVIVIRDDIPNADHPRARRLSVAANQIAKTDFNPDGELLKEWAGEDEAIKALFADDEWTKVTGEQPETKDAEAQIDRAAELLEKWRVKTGDLWQIGEHRLLCGDSTKREDVERVMGGEKADLVITSPPYNQGNNWSEFLGSSDKKMYEHSEDDMSEEEYREFIFSVLGKCSEIVNDIHTVAWNVAYNAKSRDSYGKILFSNRNPFTVKESIVWDKHSAINLTSIGIYSRRCEFVFVMSKGDKYLTNQKKGEARWNYWETKRPQQQEGHRATFPIEFAERAITELSLVNSAVFEPFIGSGTTLVACENLGRRGRGIEISPAYCAMTLERMSQAFAGIEIRKSA